MSSIYAQMKKYLNQQEDKNMSEYQVEIRETLSRTYTIEAESKEKALEIIKNAVNKSEIILDADDFISRDIEIAD